MAKPGYRDYVLQALPGTRQEVGAKTGLATMTVHRWTVLLHAAGEIYVSAWRRSPKGPPVAVFSVGAHPDKRCNIKKLTDAQLSERYRQKLKREGKWEDRKEYRARAERVRRLTTAIRPAATWLSAIL